MAALEILCCVPSSGDAVADFVIGEGAAFINAEGAAAASPGIGPAGHGMAEIDSSEDDHEDSDADDEHGHHQEEYEDAILADDDMHILPPQLDGHHHPHEVWRPRWASFHNRSFCRILC